MDQPKGGARGRGDRRWGRLGGALAVAALGVGLVGVVAPAAPAGAQDGTLVSVQIPDPPGLTEGIFPTAVSCPAVGSCVGVATAYVSTGVEAVVESENPDGTWSPSPLPLTPAGASDQLDGVSCPAVGSCVAVGEYTTGGDYLPLVETESDGTWAAATLDPLGTSLAELTSVSCPAVGSCVAVGYYVTANGAENWLVLTLAGGVWTPTTGGAPEAPSVLYPQLDSVSCTGSVSSCVAVGNFYVPTSNGDGVESFAEVETAGSWTGWGENSFGISASSYDIGLASVSCPAVSQCWAVGYTYPGTGQVGADGSEDLIESFTGSSWTPEPGGVAPGSGTYIPGDSIALQSIACSSFTACTAVGYATATDYSPGQGVVDTLEDGSWSPTTDVGPGTPNGAILLGVALDPSGGVTAVGYDVDASDVYHAYVASAGPQPVFTTPGPANFSEGTYGVFDIAATGVTGTSITSSGELPAGLTLTEGYTGTNATATISGVPANYTAGDYDLTLYATDLAGAVGTEELEVVVAGNPALAPTVTGVSPDTGPGQTTKAVTVSGTNFGHVEAVSFGGQSARFNSDYTTKRLSVYPPPGYGTVPVTVVTNEGTSPPVSADLYTYLAPVVTGISPASGPTAGGTKVTVTGADFGGAAAVDFGDLSAESFTVNATGTSITAVSPPGSGTVDVTVSSPSGSSATVTADQFTYQSPVLTAMSPTSGPGGGGVTVTLTGTGLSGATAVDFGSAPAERFTVNPKGTGITAVAPPGTGAVAVTVVTPGATSAPTLAAVFTYLAPTVSAISPVSGPQGTVVTVTGTNFIGAAYVFFGGLTGTSVHVVSDTELTVRAPAGTGTQLVQVLTPAGESIGTVLGAFTFTRET